MKPGRWWRAVTATDALGPQHRARSMVGLGRVLTRVGPSLYAVVAWRASQQPDLDALVDADGPVSYRELTEVSDDLARWLLAHHLGSRSDTTIRRIALFGRAPRHTIVGLLAAQRLGIDSLLLNTMASSAEIDAIVAAKRCLVLSDDPAIGDVHPPPATELTTTRSELAAASKLRRVRRAPTIAILTSGTTGTPALIERRPPVSAVDTIADFVVAIGARRGDRVSLMLPVFHGHGLATVALSLTLGGTLHLRSPADQRRDDYRADWDAIEAGATDLIVAVPTVLQRLVHAAPTGEQTPQTTPPRPTVRSIVTGSAPLAASTLHALTSRFGGVVHNVYGTSETGVVTHAGPADLARDPATVGRPLLGVECEIRPLSPAAGSSTAVVATGQLNQVGQVGELWVRGGMSGRHWQPTHDLGSFDERGQLRLHGRSDSVLVIGGENVVPEALEERISTLPGVVECAVRGIPDDEYGTRVELLVRLAASTSVDDLRQVLTESLPRTLRPKSIVEVDRLPRTALGKLQRRSLPGGAAT